MVEKTPAWLKVKRWVYRSGYLQTKYWKDVCKVVRKRANNRCEVKGCLEVGLDVHHTTYRIFGGLLSILFFEWLFLHLMVCLCRMHHRATHEHHTLELKDGRIMRPFGHKFPKGDHYV